MRRAAWILTVIFCLLSPVPSLAGDCLGLTAGLALGDLTGRDVKRDTSFRTGLVVGGFGYLDVSSWMGLSIEMLYIQKGASWKVYSEADGMMDDGTSTMKLDYLEFPFLMKVGLLSDELRLAVSGGVSLDFNVRSRMETNYKTAADRDESLDEISFLDIGFILGGVVGLGPLDLDFRINWGSLTVDAAEGVFDYMDWRTVTTTIMLQYRFQD